MKMTINSTKLKRVLTFCRPDSNPANPIGPIFVNLNGWEGRRGRQLAQGGKFLGPVLLYEGDDLDEFQAVCREWHRAYTAEN